MFCSLRVCVRVLFISWLFSGGGLLYTFVICMHVSFCLSARVDASTMMRDLLGGRRGKQQGGEGWPKGLADRAVWRGWYMTTQLHHAQVVSDAPALHSV